MPNDAKAVLSAANAPSAAEARTASWFFENADHLFAVVDAEGRFTTVNPAWGTVTGWSHEDLIGRPMMTLIHADSQEAVREIGREVVLTGTACTTFRLAHRDGGWVWLEGYARRGSCGEIMGMLRDVTAERLRTEEMERVQKGHSRLGETAGIGIWRFDPDTKVFHHSPEWRSILAGEGVDMTTGEDRRSACHPEDLPRVLATIDKVVREGGTEPMDHRIQAASGRWLHVRCHIWLETRLDGGRMVHGISQNVTELVEALEAAAAARAQSEGHSQRLDLALRSAGGAVIEVDYQAGQVWTSPEFLALTGRTMTFEEACSAVWPIVHPDDADTVLGMTLQWGGQGQPPPIDARMLRPDGESIWTRLYLQFEMTEDGRWLRSVGLLLDIDERKRQELALVEAEKAAQAGAEAKSTFLANMSHEIRTPMNGVLGVLHLLKDEPDPQAARALIDEALACGAMLQALLDDVVDFSKIEAGRLELSCEPTDPAAVVQGVARLLRPQAEAKGLSLNVEMDGLPAWVLADAVRLRQCLFNLMGNAVKFTAEGSVTVRAAARPSAEGMRLRFEVQDTGIGIAEEAQARLFQRFQQADASTTRRFGGSGLGLAITRTLVELMDGETDVVSAPGQGSTFWFEIAAPLSEPPVAIDLGGATVLEGLRILVVEDNPTNRMIATKMLESLGASIETAEDGERGVQAAARGGFDLILMDIQMPGIDGMEATRQVRALDGPAAATPIIALTANVLSHQRHIYLGAGMDGVIGKPISPTALLAEISRLAGMGRDADADADAEPMAASA
ncbi:ATP-binding protein [uncultured Phenylobacterium sp.]|uniref:ATP-binding protein n=1 Tax=uncultured Phenylobacterium sp. TaxID=349273 RepID=UPI0025CB9A16|nr:ATP-binding protein [uncultured Phenylobacterium sp.]